MKHSNLIIALMGLTIIALTGLYLQQPSQVTLHPKIVEVTAPQTELEAGETITVEATAYTHAAPGGDINGTGDGVTYSGLHVARGVIAVDPAVIPLGSLVYVEQYGYAVAADTGGGIDGREIDVFIPSRNKALDWGRKEVEVEIIRETKTVTR